MAFYRICPDCGAYLDPGEQCSCHEEHMLKQEKREKAIIFIEKMMKEEKNGQAAERILKAMDNSRVPVTWREMDRCALQSVIAKELILIDKEAR